MDHFRENGPFMSGKLSIYAGKNGPFMAGKLSICGGGMVNLWREMVHLWRENGPFMAGKYRANYNNIFYYFLVPREYERFSWKKKCFLKEKIISDEEGMWLDIGDITVRLPLEIAEYIDRNGVLGIT